VIRSCLSETLKLSSSYLAVYKEQLMALNVIPGDPDSAAKAFTDLKTKTDKEKATQETTQTEVDTLSRVVKDLKISANKFAAQIPTKGRLNT
jgi:hypothetical protein